MSASIERKRAACFAWLEQCHRTAQVRGVAIEQRGRVIRSADYVAPIGASEERFARGAGTRGADALRALALPTPVVRKSASNLVSPSKFLTWYLPRFMARTLAPVHVATDASRAVLDAGLADLEKVSHGRYLVVARDATPTWEYDGLKTPHVTPSVKPFHGTEIALYGRLTPAEYAHGLASYEPRSMVPVAVAEQSAADPMRYFPMASALQRQAKQFLAEHGEKMPLPDVFDTKKMRWHSRPDRVAHRGDVRVARRAPMRYEHGYRVIVGEDGRKHLVPALDNVQLGQDGQYQLATVLARRYYCTCGPVIDQGCTLAPTGGYQRLSRKCRCEPVGWKGHERATFPRAQLAQRADSKASKVKSGRRAPNVQAGPWSMSERSLQRATRTMGDAVATLENAIRSAGDGVTVRFPDGTRVVVHGVAQVFDGERMRMYPVREWARRTVLATLAAASE